MFNKIYEKTYSEEHVVNSRYELLRQDNSFAVIFHHRKTVVLLLIAHILSLQDVALRRMFFIIFGRVY